LLSSGELDTLAECCPNTASESVTHRPNHNRTSRTRDNCRYKRDGDNCTENVEKLVTHDLILMLERVQTNDLPAATE
jgi:hypothetical protein